jgi:8-amino-7-oxononanoate synthase
MSMGDVNLNQWVDEALAEREQSRLLRVRRPVRVIDATHIEHAGKAYVNFASNNYLGLTHHPRVIAAATEACTAGGAGSGAAALITGYSEEHQAAEREIAAWKRTEASVLQPSGYQANQAAVQSIAAVAETLGRGIRFLIDKLAHASLIDGVRAAGHEFRVFPHNGFGKLERLLVEANRGEMQVVVTESIFSMDGDAADLDGLAALKEKYPFVLVLDEAHGSGVYGPGGSGYASEVGRRDAVDVSVVTLSKALGCAGGAICASRGMCEAVVNFGRAFVYSTNVPPSVPAAARAAIAVMRDEPERQRRLRDLARRVRTELRDAGVDVPGLADCPILPVVFGDEAAALDAADRLRERGMWVVAMRPPTVPPGSSRLRVTVSSGHTDDEVAGLVAAIRELAV